MKCLLVVLASILLKESYGQTCPNGKVYSTCGTMCPLTCENKDGPPMPCPAICIIGCFCPYGTIEYGNGCVAPVDCPTNTTNGKPAFCQLPPVSGLCEAYMPSFFYNATSKQCESFVYGGCGGNKNRFQTKESCMESCGDQACPKGKVYTTCGTMCPLTCENKDGPPVICVLACKIGCVCPSGMVEHNGGCVHPDNCPATTEPACRAGGIQVTNGGIRRDGCSKCTCTNHRITCSVSGECVNPIRRSFNIKMKFSGDFDIVSQDLEGFKLHFKTSLVTKYQSFNLQESQITNIDVYRGSIVVQITVEDLGEDEEEGLPDSANVTLLLVHLEQDYNSSYLTIEYQDMTLEPSGEFSYEESDSDEDESSCFWALIGIFVAVFTIILLFLAVAIVGVFFFFMMNDPTTRRRKTPLPADVKCDFDGEKLKDFSNPAIVKR